MYSSLPVGKMKQVWSCVESTGSRAAKQLNKIKSAEYWQEAQIEDILGKRNSIW